MIIAHLDELVPETHTVFGRFAAQFSALLHHEIPKTVVLDRLVINLPVCFRFHSSTSFVSSVFSQECPWMFPPLPHGELRAESFDLAAFWKLF